MLGLLEPPAKELQGIDPDETVPDNVKTSVSQLYRISEKSV